MPSDTQPSTAPHPPSHDIRFLTTLTRRGPDVERRPRHYLPFALQMSARCLCSHHGNGSVLLFHSRNCDCEYATQSGNQQWTVAGEAGRFARQVNAKSDV